MIILGVQIKDSSGLRGSRSTLRRIQKQALHETAEYWHRVILARHFSPGAAAGYHYKPRTAWYLKVRKPRAGKGPGKFISLLLEGTSRRAMQNQVSIAGTKDRQTVRMFVPSYFTNPFIGRIVSRLTGKQKRITQQPDKLKEILSLSNGDRQQLRDKMQDRIIELFVASRTTTTVNLKP